MILKSSVCLLLLLCASLPELCPAAEAVSLGEHFLTTVGLHRVADMIATDSSHLTAAIQGVLHVKSSKMQKTKDGRGVEKRELEIALRAGNKDATSPQKAELTYIGEEVDLQAPKTENITLFDRLQHHRWHDAPGEVMILRKKIPSRVDEDFSSKVIKLPPGTLRLLDGALQKRRQHAEWFASEKGGETVAGAMAAELKGADPLWALVLRMWLCSHGNEKFAHEWTTDSGTQVAAYEAALVMHMFAKHDSLSPVFDPLVEKSLHHTGTAGGLALGALCASVSCEHGLICWYECKFVHPKTGMSWEDWMELAPAIPKCPPYGLACRLSLAHHPKPQAAGSELLHRVLVEMSLVEK